MSVETVYKTYGGKPGLVRALCERALAGVGPVAAEIRSDELQLRESDPYVIIRGWGSCGRGFPARLADHVAAP